ncbi:hypothetical protein A3L12_03385 [Thermococcus sp. P6]|uniref:NitrOD5 domain-containing protein n=1 Tax=Thermococcus sp. P6 TaxID=122420 RepID=UPI000B5A14D4|nr:NitrOD5 domain-containing protein [Thermococcus sp. P6]ASJ10408.1 hypothetical protein A3L12_03385 [Thermococcus sp. P6]
MNKFNAKSAIVVATAEEVLKTLGPYFEITIRTYLESKYGKGIEYVGEDPRRFYEAIRDLFGEFAAKMFIYNLVRELGIPVRSRETEQLLKGLEEYLGGE